MNDGGHHLPTHDRSAMDALLNTYATGAAAGVWTTGRSIELVGANRRKILTVQTPDGVYVGGVLVANPADLRDYAAALLSLAADLTT